MASLTFLGSGDSQGVPRWWCNCKVCNEARSTGQNARTRPSVLLRGAGGQILLDAAPELRLQLTRENVRDVDAAIITHAHSDHILGLSDLADQARWTGQPTPMFAPAEVIPQISNRFDYLTRGSFERLVPMRAVEATSRTFAGFTLSAHRVPHGANGYAYGLRFSKETYTWAYVSDSFRISDLTPWQNLDLLVLGTSFYKEDAPAERRSVYDVREAVELIGRLEPKRTVFTHLGHGIDSRKQAPPGTVYAYDGLTIEF